MQSGAAHKVSLISLIFLVITANAAFTADRLVINEIMINEPGSETALEWVELFNAGSDSLNLKNYIFIEAADTTRFATRWLRPQAFVILARKPNSTDGSASFERQWGNASGIWGDDSLENYILLPAKMSLRNSNDSVTLVDVSNRAAETVKWSSSPPDGVSLERINPMNSATAKNFRYCQSPELSTPGRINSVIAKPRDWGFIEDECEMFIPPGPEQPVVFQLTIRNFGQTAAASLQCDFILDRDFNGVVSGRDSIIELDVGALGTDSTIVLMQNYSAAAGRHAFIFQLSADDGNANNAIYFEAVIGPVARELLISEIVCNAGDSSGGEWIELQSVVNYEVALAGWSLEIDGSKVDIDSSARIQPSERFIVCADSSEFKRAFAEIGCRLVEPKSWRPLLDGAGSIALRMQLGAISDSISYRGSIEAGRSWERDLDSNTTIFESQFHRSTSVLGSTPCDANSVRPAPIAHDLGIARAAVALTRDSIDDSRINARFVIENHGYQNAVPFAINVFDDVNRDDNGSNDELVLQHDVAAIASGDSANVEITLTLGAGRRELIFALPDDDDSGNNVAAATITVGAITHELIVNEFLANPTGELESEWIEVQNNSRYPVNLQGWTFGDGLNQYRLANALSIAPGEYRVLAQDALAFGRFYGDGCVSSALKTWSNLNNSGDIIIVSDEFGTLSDSVRFEHVGGDNRSMERLDHSIPGLPDWNLSTSATGSTPCAPNSQQAEPLAVDIGFVTGGVVLQRDSLPEITVRAKVAVTNRGYASSPPFELEVFDNLNRDGSLTEDEFVLRESNSGVAASDTVQVEFDIDATPGRHNYVFVLPDDLAAGDNSMSAGITIGPITREIIITEYLADPAAPLESEWFEVRNLTGFSIDLTNWSCGDRTTTHQLANAAIISPGEYLVIAQDSAAFAQYYGDGCRVIAPDSWSSLNNDGDVIVLRDEFGTVSDSLIFSACAGGIRSTERNESSEIANAAWYVCNAQSGATPCAPNSVSGEYSGTTELTLLNRVFAPLDGEELRFNLQCLPSSRFTIEVFDLAGRKQRTVADDQYFSSGDYSYDGSSDHAGLLTIGAYILKIESDDGAFAQKIGFAVAPPK